MSSPAGIASASSSGVEHVLHSIRREFLEMPGLRLTAAQAQRLWNLDALVCDALLAALVDARFLKHLADGTFLRRDDHVQVVASTFTRLSGSVRPARAAACSAAKARRV